MGSAENLFLKSLLAFAILPPGFCNIQPVINPSILTQSSSLGECQACKLFIFSFKNGLERTTRGNYEGGDTAWEEEKLKKSYKRSEMRLIDIQDGLCKENSKNSVQCHYMAEKAEEYIEEWWAQDPEESEDIFTYICIDKLKVCCPEFHYGKDCLPCLGDHSNLCNGNGKCRGDGTRKGNGTCLCDAGYTGESCDQCASGYYTSYEDDNKILCSKCHKSCASGCRHGTRKDCFACKPGYIFDSNNGCHDINECDEVKCAKNHFCLNSIGSYKCAACDKSCIECFGDGPDMCRKCAKGYFKQGEFCIAERQEEDLSDKMANTRYLTYIGLLVATGILLPKSASLGSLVGAMVFIYIVSAEYYCMINGHSGLVNLKDYDLWLLLRT